MMIIGWVGVAILVLSYILLLVTDIKWFYLADTIASILLTWHAIMIQDVPFIIVNGFIAGVLLKKFIGEMKKNVRQK